MLELPESSTIARQLNETVRGKRVVSLEVNHTPHGFAWLNGSAADYTAWLCGKTVENARGLGSFVEIQISDFLLLVNDGTNVRSFGQNEKLPKKHQLHLEFSDGTHLFFSVQMYGGMTAHPAGKTDNEYYQAALQKPSPLTDAFDRAYFESLIREASPNLSAKAFLATQQRIPGLGNGVLQDILFQSGIHPKRKIGGFTSSQWDALYRCVKNTLRTMTDGGGRNTEKDLFGHPGGYQTLLSKKTIAYPCPKCGGGIVKTVYLGGSVYFCPCCQPPE